VRRNRYITKARRSQKTETKGACETTSAVTFSICNTPLLPIWIIFTPCGLPPMVIIIMVTGPRTFGLVPLGTSFHLRLCSCQVSRGVYSNSDVDHIIPLNLGGLSTESNLQIICVPCHRRKTALESRKICRRMTEPEPSLVYIDYFIRFMDKFVYSVTGVHPLGSR